jgi:hypothetical protein
MLDKCVQLEHLCRRQGQEQAAVMWECRTEATRAWNE